MYTILRGRLLLMETEERRENHRWVKESVAHPKGTERYEELRRMRLREIYTEIRSIENEISRQQHQVQTWKRRLTYDEQMAGVKLSDVASHELTASSVV